MSKAFEFSVIFIFLFIMCVIAEMSPKMNFISKFTFDISADNHLVVDKNINGLKISEALARLSYASFELKIQLRLLKEFQKNIIPSLYYVFGEKTLNENSFNGKTFIKNAYFALKYEINSLLDFVAELYQEFDEEGPRKYFTPNVNYPLPNDRFIHLKNWWAMFKRRVLDEHGNFNMELAEINVIRSIFAHDILESVMNELRNVLDASSAEDIIFGQSADQQHYFEEQGREEWKKFLVFVLNKKVVHLQKDSFEKVEKTVMEEQIGATRWARIRFEYIYMHLNVIWLLLNGIEKYVNYVPELMQKPKSPIKIMQMENELTKDYEKRIGKMITIATENLELINLFVANLKKGEDEDKNRNINLSDDKQMEKKQEIGHKVLGILRDHHFISKWVNPKNKINWMALDAANLEAFADYTGQKFDRRNLGMVLQRQLLTEIGALKIVQNYVANRGKDGQKMEANLGEASHSVTLH